MFAFVRRPYQTAFPLLAIVTASYLFLWRPTWVWNSTTAPRTYSHLSWTGTDGSDSSPSFNKTIVVASTASSNTTWVRTDLTDWYQVVYVVDDPQAEYHTKANRGNEANVYLTYIIDNYDHLPASVVFTHDHLWSNHVGWAFHNTSELVQHLNLSALQERGYTSLSCFHDGKCDYEWLGVWNSYDDKLKAFWPIINPGEEMPLVSGPPNGQFGASRAAIRARPRSDYQRLHDWLMKNEEGDFYSGRHFEHTWHAIFGRPAIDCKLEDECLCEDFQICDIMARKEEMRGFGVIAKAG